MKFVRLALFALLALAVGLIAPAAGNAALVAVVPRSAGYYTSIARHVSRNLADAGVASTSASAPSMAQALAPAKIAFLVGFDKVTQSELKTLSSFCRRGGKLVVFHSPSPELARLVGVQPLGYRSATRPGELSRMDFLPGASPPGTPKAIRQSSGGIERAAPVRGRARVMATWTDRQGRPTGEAAWIATDVGWWMTHVLLSGGDEDLKGQLLASLVGAAVPALWNYRGYARRVNARRESWTRLGAAQRPRAGEIHAVWDHGGVGLYPGDWMRTMRVLKSSHVTDIYVNVAGAGFAHYPSAVLPRSKVCRDEGDQLAACVAAGRACGVRVHAWILCFTATRSDPATLESFRKRGWRLADSKGRLTEYLNPSRADVQNHLLRAIDEIQSRYAVDGIHLDFVRWYEGAAKPANAAAVIRSFVAAMRRRVSPPHVLSAAVLGKYPACVASVGQDWPTWIDLKLVDYVAPMNYTADGARFGEYLAVQGSLKSRARRTIAGIGVSANESRLDAAGVIGQINQVRRAGLAGVALFDLDQSLEKNVLPYLRLGMW